jgi:hypothetical protein
LNSHQFLTLAKATEKMEIWRINYNKLRTFWSMAPKSPISLPVLLGLTPKATNHRS